MQDKKTLDLSIVIPVYNSSNILPTLIEQLETALLNNISSYEILLVNDASTDGSWKTIEQLSKTKIYLKGMNLRRNTGHHNAVMAGLNHAQGGVIVLMDDDLQHSPSDVPALYSRITDGYDACFANFEKMRQAWWKRLGSSFNDLLVNALIKKPRNINFSSYKAFSHEIKDEVVKFTSPFVYLDAIIFMVTNNLTSIIVQHHERLEGKGNYTFRKSVSLWLKMATGFSLMPLRFASILGIITATLGFLFTIVMIIIKLSGFMDIPVGWTSLACIALVIGGMQLLAIGVIGEYIGRTYISLNNVPTYSIKDKINF